jgi:hypothetical protein
MYHQYSPPIDSGKFIYNFVGFAPNGGALMCLSEMQDKEQDFLVTQKTSVCIALVRMSAATI